MPRKFLVVADESPEFDAALRYASRRARSTGGRVALLRVIPSGSDAHWSGVRDDIQRELREEAERLLNRLGQEAQERSGAAPQFLIEEGEPVEALRRAVEQDPEIKILVLASSVGGRGPGPLVTAAIKGLGGRKLPVTIVPGELSDKDVEDLA
ncbi:MAG: universal stress protein [Caulobacteraceae bacterium]|nr:universal stress protein [Caulobacteraceae bacterium]